MSAPFARGERSQRALRTDRLAVAAMAEFTERVYLALEADPEAFDGRGDVLWAMVLEARRESDVDPLVDRPATTSQKGEAIHDVVGLVDEDDLSVPEGDDSLLSAISRSRPMAVSAVDVLEAAEAVRKAALGLPSRPTCPVWCSGERDGEPHVPTCPTRQEPSDV